MSPRAAYYEEGLYRAGSREGVVVEAPRRVCSASPRPGPRAVTCDVVWEGAQDKARRVDVTGRGGVERGHDQDGEPPRPSTAV